MKDEPRKLKDWIDGFMELTENTVESPYLYRFWTAASCVAAALQRKVFMEWSHSDFFANMYVVLIGPSGKARKGTAMRPGIQILREIGIKVAADSVTRERLIRDIKESNFLSIDKDGKHIMHSSLTIFNEELTVFLGYQNKELITNLISWYDCQPNWEYKTKNMGEDRITGVWVNMLGATTPELINSSLPRDTAGGGLASRLIFVFESAKGKILPFPFLGPKEIELKENLKLDLEKIHLMAGKMKPTEKYLETYGKWYSEENPKDEQLFDTYNLAPYYERRQDHVRKLSMVLCASRADNKMVLTDKDFNKALEIIKATEINMPKAVSGIGRSPYSEVIPRVIEFCALKKELTFNDLVKKFVHDATLQELDAIVKSLEMVGAVQRVIGGREPIIRYIKGEQK